MANLLRRRAYSILVRCAQMVKLPAMGAQRRNSRHITAVNSDDVHRGLFSASTPQACRLLIDVNPGAFFFRDGHLDFVAHHLHLGNLIAGGDPSDANGVHGVGLCVE